MFLLSDISIFFKFCRFLCSFTFSSLEDFLCSFSAVSIFSGFSKPRAFSDLLVVGQGTWVKDDTIVLWWWCGSSTYCRIISIKIIMIMIIKIIIVIIECQISLPVRLPHCSYQVLVQFVKPEQMMMIIFMMLMMMIIMMRKTMMTCRHKWWQCWRLWQWSGYITCWSYGQYAWGVDDFLHLFPPCAPSTSSMLVLLQAQITTNKWFYW